MTGIPGDLSGHETLSREDPRREAKDGLFLHYRLYSFLGRHDWVQLRERIPVAEYAALTDRFRAVRFDADPSVTELDGLVTGDLDGNGQVEIACAEHDPFSACRGRYGLPAHEKAEPHSKASLHPGDDRFEHHGGMKVLEIAAGRVGIISHVWTDSRYVNHWEAP